MNQLFKLTGKKAEGKLADKYRSIRPRFEQSHNSLWPGVPIPDAVFGCKNAAEMDLEAIPVQAFTQKATVPTSMAVAMLLWGFSSPWRKGDDRVRSLDVLRDLCMKLIQAGIEFDLQVKLVGTTSVWRQAKVSKEGRVPGMCLWGHMGFQQCHNNNSSRMSPHGVNSMFLQYNHGTILKKTWLLIAAICCLLAAICTHRPCS